MGQCGVFCRSLPILSSLPADAIGTAVPNRLPNCHAIPIKTARANATGLLGKVNECRNWAATQADGQR